MPSSASFFSRDAVTAVGPAGALLGLCLWAGCPQTTAPPLSERECPSLELACPGLSCVEPRRDETGCPVCECEVQACVVAGDCTSRGIGVVCDTGPRFCEPAPGCTDGDSSSPCPAACFGRCLYDDERSRNDGFCTRGADCAAGEECRQSVCVDDPTTVSSFDCIGWCAGGCFEAETMAFDPMNGSCVLFPDSCIPPGWILNVCQ
jgi:hypothetical protein